MDWFLVAKWLHILSATVLFGTGIGTAFQMIWAMRSGRAATLADVAAGVVVADWPFTTPAGIPLPATGLWLARLAGHALMSPGLVVTYALCLIAFACWAPAVVLQIRIRDLAREATAQGAPFGCGSRWVGPRSAGRWWKCSG